jgi:hypothetical protein
MIALIVGFTVGVIIGFALCAMLSVGSQYDDETQKIWEEKNAG